MIHINKIFKMAEENQQSRSCVEISSIIFAVFHNVILSIACAVSYIWLFIQVVWMIMDHHSPSEDSAFVVTAILVAVSSCSTIAFAFSVVLTVGLLQKKSDYVKTYCVYGSIVLALCVTAGVILLLLFASTDHIDILLNMGIGVLSSCIIYTAILGMIWKAYKTIRQDNLFYKHNILLQEKF